jgi:hypothetical protein
MITIITRNIINNNGDMDEYTECAHKAVEWFLRKQRSKGTWPGGFHPFDIVDTSFAL